MTDTDDFDWNSVRENGSIVQQQVERIAVYDNPNGDLVIRQERRWDEDQDVFIIIAKNNIDAVIAEMRALQALLCPDMPSRAGVTPSASASIGRSAGP